MINCLVLTESYPNLSGSKAMYYVHSRNLGYIKNGITPIVLSFSAKEDYIIDKIEVICFKNFLRDIHKYYDYVLISHAPNIRHHYSFIKKYGHIFIKKIFIFHGHEILHIHKYYPKQYNYINNNLFLTVLRNIYDDYKLFLWKKYFEENVDDVLFFVSNFLKSIFLTETKLDIKMINKRCYVIPNCVGNYFEKHSYSPKKLLYDFITIRSNLDNSNYCIDILCKLCDMYSDKTFLLIGKGDYFKYNVKPKNLVFIEKVLSHVELSKYICSSRCALMLTKHDSHGLMSSELATYGIPLITSNIKICREVFKTFKNVIYINNNNPKIDFGLLLEICKSKYKKNDIYIYKNTILKEICLINKYGKKY